MNKAFVFACSLLINACVFGRGPLVPYRDGKKWGYSDTMGKIVIAPKYDRADIFNYKETFRWSLKPVGTVVVDEKILAIDEKGQVLVPGKYESIEVTYTKDGIIFVVSNAKGKKGLFAKGKEILPCVYDDITPAPNDSYQLQQNKVGLVNSQGKILIPLKYDYIYEGEKNKAEFIWKAATGLS